jgi:hypothetical protein
MESVAFLYILAAMMLIVAMATVILAWLVIGGALLGIGLLPRAWITRARVDQPWELFAAFWLGLGAVIGVQHLLHFVMPMTPAVGWGIIGLGWLGLLARKSDLSVLSTKARAHPHTVAAIFLASIWIANRAIGPGDAHDSGLYHFNVIRWTNEYAIVPGIANLSGPLGMNQSSLLFTAAFNHWPLEGRAHHVANSLLVIVLLCHVLPCIAGLLNRKASAGPTDRSALYRNAFAAMLAPVIVMLAVNKDISSPKTDLAAGVVLIAAAILAVRGLTTPRDQVGTVRWLFLSLVITVSCALTACLKLSAAPAALVLWIIGAWMYVRTIGFQSPTTLTTLACSTAAGLALLVAASSLMVAPWMARSAVLSGYLLFPVRLLSIDVEWKVPDEHVHYLKEVIAKHGQGELPLFITSKLERSPFKALAPLTRPPFENRLDVQGLNWVRAWVFSQPFVAPIEVVLPAGISVLLIVTLAGLRRRTDSQFETGVPQGGSGNWVLLPVIVGIAAWLLVAPVGRYAWPLWWILAAGLGALCVSRAGGIGTGRVRASLLFAGAAVCMLPLVVRMGMVAVLEERNPLRTLPFHTAGSEGGFHPIPSEPLGLVTTRHGIEVWVPMIGSPELVWDSPLPACPWPPVDLDLALRVEGQLGSGFKIKKTPEGKAEPYPPPRHAPVPAESLPQDD